MFVCTVLAQGPISWLCLLLHSALVAHRITTSAQNSMISRAMTLGPSEKFQQLDLNSENSTYNNFLFVCNPSIKYFTQTTCVYFKN